MDDPNVAYSLITLIFGSAALLRLQIWALTFEDEPL